MDKFAASRPSLMTKMTKNDFMQYLSRSLKTKTHEAPSTVHAMVNRLYGGREGIAAFAADFPDRLRELLSRLDFLDRGRSTAWYLARCRQEISAFRHELEHAVLARRFPPPDKLPPDDPTRPRAMAALAEVLRAVMG